ncbi:hypothetical protein BY996DRAFT_7029182 [Phakopsora pachyrhizi]|nr:hypothetical protein BY996DRAFT_7029182 [Phakopsora pachyrhizi]
MDGSDIDGLEIKEDRENYHESKLQLPVSTWFAKKTLRFQDYRCSERRNFNKFTRYLNLIIVREVATLENDFVNSSLYRLIERVRPTILPSSSSYPFILTILIGSIQIKRLWTRQRDFLIQLLVVSGPAIRTLQTLRDIQSVSDCSKQLLDTRRSVIRWLVYWIIYGSIISLESWKVWVSTRAGFSPTIYPSTRKSRRIGRSFKFYSLPNKSLSSLWSNFRSLITQPLNYSSIYRNNTSTNTPPRSRRGDLLEIESNSLSSSSPRALNLLPDHLFGDGIGKTVYLTLKVIFLRWCSGKRSQGSMKIWENLICPISELLLPMRGGDISRRPSGKSKRVVKVLVVSECEGEGLQAGSSDRRVTGPDRITQDGQSTVGYHLPVQSSADLFYQPEDVRPKTCFEQRSSPIRRIRSDPTPAVSSSCSSDLIRPEPSPSSPSLENNLSSNSNVGVDLKSGIRRSRSNNHQSAECFTINSVLSLSSSSPLSNDRKNFHHHHHHGFMNDFKSSENAWDSMSLNVSS